MQTKWATATRSQCSELTLIEREKVADAVPVREHDERCIGKTDLHVGKPADDTFGSGDVIRIERLQPIHAPPHLGEERAFGILAHARRKQVVELREHERGQTPRRRGRLEGAARGCVLPLAGVDGGELTGDLPRGLRLGIELHEGQGVARRVTEPGDRMARAVIDPPIVLRHAIQALHDDPPVCQSVDRLFEVVDGHVQDGEIAGLVLWLRIHEHRRSIPRPDPQRTRLDRGDIGDSQSQRPTIELPGLCDVINGKAAERGGDVVHGAPGLLTHAVCDSILSI